MMDRTQDAAESKLYVALARQLKGYGIKKIFALMSEDTAMLLATLDAMDIRIYGARHENAAVAMADGYASATGELGVSIIGRGPATANSLMGSTYASRTGSKVLVIYGFSGASAGRNAYGPDLKRFDSRCVFHGAGIEAFEARSATSACNTLHDAVCMAMSGAFAAYLLPVDIQEETVVVERAHELPVRAVAPTQVDRAQALSIACALVDKAERPLIVAGWGAHLADSKSELIRLADQIGAVVCTTMKGKDLFSDYPFNAGIVGSFSSAMGRRLIESSDCVLVFGAGLNQRTTSKGASIPKNAPIIHIDHIRSKIGQWHSADVEIVGDVLAVAEELSQKVKVRSAAEKPLHSEEFRSLVKDFNPSAEFAALHTAHTVDPRSAAIAVNRILPRFRNVVWDAGNFLGLLSLIDVPGPAHLKSTSDFGSIGLGLGVALGFAVARPEETTLLVIGDGGLLMSLGELETLAREGINLTVLVINDAAFGAETHFLRNRGMPVARSLFADVDFANLAQSLGIDSLTIRSMEDFDKMAALWTPGSPMLVDCKVNGNIAAAFTAE